MSQVLKVKEWKQQGCNIELDRWYMGRNIRATDERFSWLIRPRKFAPNSLCPFECDFCHIRDNKVGDILTKGYFVQQEFVRLATDQEINTLFQDE